MNTPIKITPIVENKSKRNDLSAEHGLSLLIEGDNQRILFDTGASDLLVKNARILNINLTAIDCVILSHGHYDHLGGLIHIKNINVYTHPDIFIPKYEKINDQYAHIGMPHDKEYYEQKNGLQFIEVLQNTKLTKNISLHTNFKIPEPTNFYLKKGDDYTSDLFTDELALSINTKNGVIIISGCSHSGITNIIEKVLAESKTKKIHALLGGLHFFNFTQEEIKQAAKKINSYQISNLGISHCTGSKLADHLHGSQVFDFNIGDSFAC